MNKFETKPLNRSFLGYVTRVGFNLTLSKEQIIGLVALAEQNESWKSGRFVPIMKALIRKGLAEHHDWFTEPEGYGGRRLINSTGTFKGPRPSYTLTREGELVVELLENIGLTYLGTENTNDRTECNA